MKLMLLNIILSACGLYITRNDVIVSVPVAKDIQWKSKLNIENYLAANSNNNNNNDENYKEEDDFLASEFNGVSGITSTSNSNNDFYFQSPVKKRNFRGPTSLCYCCKTKEI